METVTKKSTQQKNFTVNLNNVSSQKVNILMVDDHPENLLALEAVLSSPNYHLVKANSGKEALKHLISQEFAVILLDVQMPGLSGFETAKLIRAREKTKHTPIIFITAISQDSENVKRGYSVGAIDYIFKPFHPETLRQKIGKFVELHKKYQEEISKSEWKRKVALNEMNQKLDSTALDLRTTEALNKVISKTLIDTIILFDTEGCILKVTSGVKKMFGYHPDELVGKNVSVLLPDKVTNDKEDEPNNFISFLYKELGKVIEVIALRKDESYFPADIQIGATKVEGQQIYICTIRDVTERKQIEEVKRQQFNNLEKMVEERTIDLMLTNEKLQQEIVERRKMTDHLSVSQERFRKIFEASPCLMAIFSLNDLTIIDINASWSLFTGYQHEELLHQKMNLLDFIEEDSGKVINIDQPIRNLKIQYRTKNGEMRFGLLSSELIDIEPDPCLLFVLTDITESNLLQKELSRLDRLNLIGEMAAGIAHEIRNPMTTVHGFLQVAKGNNVSNDIIDLMLDELNRANSIITEFLNLAKNKVSDKRMQNINTIIEAILPLISAEATRNSKQIIHQLRDCSEIYVDEKEIRQLILNMALNGLDAMDAGGKLIIETYEENEQAVVLKIEDQGSGMSPEVLEKIGTPFFTTKEKGTGLGLAICYSVAERHQANIDIETGSSGTTFSIRFKAGESN